MKLRALAFILLFVSISSCTPMIQLPPAPEIAASQAAIATLTATKMPLQATHILVIAPSPAVTATLGTLTTMLQGPSAATSAQGICSPFRRQLNLPGCILSFTAVPTEVVAGGSITFTWAVTGTIKVGLELHHFEGEASGRGFRSWGNLPVNGSLTIQLDGLKTGVYPFRLWADDYEAGAWSYAFISFACVTPFFSTPPQSLQPPPCLAGPAVSTLATEQVFEHGLMIWLKSEEAVYILFQPDAHAAPLEWTIPDAFEMSDANNDWNVVPPPGKYRPVNRLGKVWQNYGLLKSLGWAITPEQHFNSTTQRGYSKRLPLYFRSIDNRVIYVVDSMDYGSPNWRFYSP